MEVASNAFIVDTLANILKYVLSKMALVILNHRIAQYRVSQKERHRKLSHNFRLYYPSSRYELLCNRVQKHFDPSFVMNDRDNE